jgi:hypothetical protein
MVMESKDNMITNIVNLHQKLKLHHSLLLSLNSKTQQFNHE